MRTIINTTVIIIILTNIDLFAQTSFRLYDKTNSVLDEHSLYSLAIDSSQSIWVGSSSDIYRYIDGNWSSFKSKFITDSLSGIVSDIQVSDSGEVWFALNSNFPEYTNKKLISYNNGLWNYYYGHYELTYPYKIFIDKNNKPWFTLINWWPHQIGRDNLGTLENDTVKIIYKYPMRPPWGFYSDLAIAHDAIYIVAQPRSLLKINAKDSSWILLELKDWSPTSDLSPIHLWEDDNQLIVGGIKLCKYDGSNFIYYTKIDSLLALHNAQVTSFVRENASTLWIGTDKGHLIKFKNNFVELVKYFEGNTIAELSVDSKGNKWMLIKDKGVGVYNKDGIVNVKNEQSDQSKFYKLSQNYPNPFNSSTTLSYTVPNSEYVQIKVYDLLGREVQVLINKYQTAGTFQIIFNASLLPSGIYFYKLISDNYSDTKKMILLK